MERLSLNADEIRQGDQIEDNRYGHGVVQSVTEIQTPGGSCDSVIEFRIALHAGRTVTEVAFPHWSIDCKRF